MTDAKAAHERIDRIQNTVDSHGQMIKALSINQQEQSEALHENTILTRQIAENTQEMVYLIKGSKVLSRVILTLAAIAGAFYSLWIWASK
jgi:hypothetical protein